MEEVSAYWDSYYAQRGDGRRMPPSQFSVFVAGEMPQGVDTVVDIGCGDGRDSFLFLSAGYEVVAIDASAVAVEVCRDWLANRHEARASQAQFAQVPIGPGTGARLDKMLEQADAIVVYARFFLHAVDEKAEQELFAALEVLRHKVALVAFEFRTDRDKQQTKATPDHYRRFITPTDVVQRAVLAGYELEYFVEGFGMAKFRNDDAHVARILLRPSRQSAATE